MSIRRWISLPLKWTLYHVYPFSVQLSTNWRQSGQEADHSGPCHYFVRRVSVLFSSPYVTISRSGLASCLSLERKLRSWFSLRPKGIDVLSLLSTGEFEVWQYQKPTVRKTDEIVISHIIITGKCRVAIFRARSRIDSVKDTMNEKIINVKHGFSFREFNASRNVDIMCFDQVSWDFKRFHVLKSSMYTIYARLFKTLFDSISDLSLSLTKLSVDRAERTWIPLRVTIWVVSMFSTGND